MSKPRPAAGMVTFVLVGNESGGTRNSMVLLVQKLHACHPIDVVALCEGEIVDALRATGLPVAGLGTAAPRVIRGVRPGGPARWVGRLAWNTLWVLHRGLKLARYMVRQGSPIAHTNMGYSTMALLVARAIVRFQFVLHWRGVGMARDMRPFVWLLGRFVDRFIAVSEAARRSLPPVWRRKTRVVYNALEIDEIAAAAKRRAGELRHRAGVESNVPLIVCLGVFSPRKGQHRLIEALPAVRAARPDAVCVLIGGAVHPDQHQYLSAMKARADGLELSGAVRFLLDVPSPGELLSDANVSVVTTPGVGEGFGLVILESMVCGVPVVAFDAGAAGEVIADRATGRLVPDGDVAALARAIVDLLNDPAGAVRMGAAGAARAAALFHPQQEIQPLRDLFDELTGGPCEHGSVARRPLAAPTPRI